MPKLAVKLDERERKHAHVNFRITESVRERLTLAASRNGRSLSAEVTAMLERALEAEDLRAIFPRLIAEGIAADREAQRADLMTRAFTSFGGQHGLGFQQGLVGPSFQGPSQ